jgi:2-keto-4-pentenoate hydratase/2-oxohepta-3-ene-1,7-dioic acid hydratase in catechol pathway
MSLDGNSTFSVKFRDGLSRWTIAAVTGISLSGHRTCWPEGLILSRAGRRVPGIQRGPRCMKFALANLVTVEGERAAIALPSGFFRLDRSSPHFRRSLRSVLDDWDDAKHGVMQIAKALAEEGDTYVLPHAGARVTTPIKYPNKLVCVGGVYRDHLREFDLPAQRWPKMPMFLRPPTTSIVGPGSVIAIPPTTQQFDWEIELAVVIGRRITDASLDSARAAIAGYSVGIDLTCRDLLDRSSALGVDLVRAKAQDGMSPVGPTLVPAQFIDDPQSLRLRLYINDEIKQDGSTADMLYTVDEQIATISRFITLEPGDVIFTGSPAGSGASIGQFLKPGDQIRAEIEQVGSLECMIGKSRPLPTGYREVLCD